MTLARIGPNDPRKQTWERLFGASSVPIITADPMVTALPDGEVLPCYFVDFKMTHPAIYQNLMNHAMSQPPERSAQLVGMLSERLYPVRADGVTVIEAPDSFFGL